MAALAGRVGRRRLWVVLVAWTLGWSLLAARGGGYSWHYFAQGADLLINPGVNGGGLHLYAVHPDLQIGPIALLVAVPLNALGPTGGRLAAELALALLGPLLLYVLVLARRRLTGTSPAPVLLLGTGLLVMPVWSQVATRFTHLDDALALSFCVVAVLAVIARRPYLSAGLLAAAVDSKPWAAGFVVLILALPSATRWRAALMTTLGVLGVWLPFVLADPMTLALSRFTIENVDDSALHALGVNTANTPSWDRPAQVILGIAVAVVCVRRGRWAAVPLAVVTARLLLDPQTYPYYSSGLLVATAILDLLTPGRRWPLWTAAAGTWYVANSAAGALLQPEQVGILRALFMVGVLVTLCLLPDRTRRSRGLRVGSQARSAPLRHEVDLGAGARAR